MAEPGAAPTVALLFADKDLGEHLREALTRLGARIVHEGPAAQVRKENLVASGADVVVVNLEPDEEDHLDQLYELLDEDRQRLVFNDAEVTRGLSGWDRDRWARHLAAKLLGSDDVDPPRPEGARIVDVTATRGEAAEVVVVAEVAAVLETAAETSLETDLPISNEVELDTQDDAPNAEPQPVEPAQAPVAAELAQTQTSDVPKEALASESLEAELEALLEKDGEAEPDAVATQKPLLEDSFEDMGFSVEGMDQEADESPAEAVHDEDIQTLSFDSEELDVSESFANESSVSTESEQAPAETAAETQQPLQGLSLVDLEATESADQGSPEPEQHEAVGMSASDSSANAWDLVSMDLEPPPPPTEQPPIKQVAVDKGEQDVDARSSIAEAVVHDSPDSGLNLELVALDVAAPVRSGDEPVSEMLLDSGAGKLRHVTVLAAGADGIPEVAEFLEALPARFGSLILVVLHQAGQHAEALAEALNETSPVRVRVADEQATMARIGQVWLVPAGYRCQLGHAGRLSLEIDPVMAAGSPSIDHCLEPLAKAFGAQLTAIVMTGQGSDAAAGVARVSARGGEVWIQDPDACGAGSMAEAIIDSGLSVHVGAPAALAKKLCEDHA